jgi:hypothetical protein
MLSLESVASIAIAEMAWDQMVRAHADYRKNPTPETRANRTRAVGVYVKHCKKDDPNVRADASA